jgi:hypothetical protein
MAQSSMPRQLSLILIELDLSQEVRRWAANPTQKLVPIEHNRQFSRTHTSDSERSCDKSPYGIGDSLGEWVAEGEVVSWGAFDAAICAPFKRVQGKSEIVETRGPYAMGQITCRVKEQIRGIHRRRFQLDSGRSSKSARCSPFNLRPQHPLPRCAH